VILSVLRSAGIHPVLVDIGASGAPPDVWRDIAPQSIYIGFDPDAREMQSGNVQGFHRSTIIPHAVVTDARPEAGFYLTRSPFCSSTLPPDSASLDHYLFAPLFEVVSSVSVPATTIENATTVAGVSSIDWLKLDTQGTDLRIYKSVPRPMRDDMVALDVEPGLIDAYQGEDLFTTTHDSLTRDGWWLSRANVLGSIRMKRSSLEKTGLSAAAIEGSARTSPGWIEARYLREVERLREPRSFILAWCFALLDRQPAYAFECALEYGRRFGDDSATVMRNTALQMLQRNRLTKIVTSVRRRIPGRIQRGLARLLLRD